MRNTLEDLNNYLFEQIERLQDEELTEKDLEKEIKKNKAIVQASNQIVNVARLRLDGLKFVNEGGENQKFLGLKE